MSTERRRLPTVSAPTEGGLSVHTTALVGAATVALAARFLAVLLVNVPSAPGAAPVQALGVVSTLLAAVGIATVGTDFRPTAGVGLLFAGVFGMLGTVVPAATLPAAVAVAIGTAVFVGSRVRESGRAHGAVLSVFAITLVAALVGGIAGPTGLRSATSVLSFVALGMLPVLVMRTRWSLVRAGVVVVAVVGIGTAAPFVTGAVTLVGTGAVGTSLPVIAVAIAGVVTTASAALRQQQWLLAAGVALVALAGVPATLPRAIPFALGVVALATGVDG